MKWGVNGLGLLMVLTLISAARAEPSGLLNDTGIDDCQGNYKINPYGPPWPGIGACDWRSDSHQDGRYGRDAAAKYPEHSGFTKPTGSGGPGGFAFMPLDVNGNPIPLVGDPPVPAEMPRCIWDRVTNLIWEVKTDDGGLQDKDWTYQWGANGGTNCLGGMNCNTDSYISTLNAASVCPVSGGGTWRLPTRREQISIWGDRNLPGNHHDPAKWGRFGGGWSGDVDVSVPYPVSIWFDGHISVAADSNQVAQAVRSGPGGRPVQQGYVDNGDGTVTDTVTGLMWDKCPWGQFGEDCGSGSPSNYWTTSILKDVNAEYGGVNYKGYNDWRIPNYKELESLVKITAAYPAIDSRIFPNTPGNFFASSRYSFLSSTRGSECGSSTVRVVDFNKGSLGKANSWPFCQIFSAVYTRLVRGGQSFDAFHSWPISLELRVEDKVYDGTTTATAGCAVIEGLMTGDTVTCSIAAANFSDANAGSNKTVTATGITLSGADPRKYTLTNTTATTTADILKAPATVTLANLTQTYTGSPLSPLATTSPASLAFTLTGAPRTNAGSYPVTAKINEMNYQGSGSGTFVIERAPSTVTLGNLVQTFTGSPLSPTLTTIPAGLPYTLTGAPKVNAGSYPVTATNPNYTGSASGTFVIQPKAATVSLSNLSRTYTGSPLSPTVTTNPAGLSYSLTGAPQTNAGTYPVTATITNPNYSGTASGTFVIAKAAQAPVYLNAPAWVRYQQAGLLVSGFGGSGTGTFTYSATGSTACTVHATSGALTITSGTGTCQVTATRQGDTNYLPASSAASVIQINKALQASLSVSANPPSITSGGPAATLSASGGSTGGTVTYAAVGSAGVSSVISGNTLKATGSAGTCSVTGTRAGNTNYEPVSSAPLAVPVLANVAPVAVNDSRTLLVTGMTPVTVAAPGLLANDTDANRDALKVAGITPRTITLANSGGRVTLQQNGGFTYTPPSANFSGSRTFTYQVTDGKLISNTATVTLTIARRPTATADTTATALNTAKVISVLANDSATAPATLNPASVVITSAPANGTAQANANGTVTYTPTTGFTGTNTFTYTVRDSLGSTSNLAMVTVYVPQARNDSYSVTANTSTSQTGTAASVGLNDVPNISGRTFTRLTNPIRTSGTGTGTLTITSFNASTGAFSYRLSGTQANKRGTFQFSYRMSLGGANTTATVTIGVR